MKKRTKWVLITDDRKALGRGGVFSSEMVKLNFQENEVWLYTEF